MEEKKWTQEILNLILSSYLITPLNIINDYRPLIVIKKEQNWPKCKNTSEVWVKCKDIPRISIIPYNFSRLLNSLN